jgi:hypothetical protein
MSDLQLLARQKAEAVMQRYITSLPNSIEAMKREHAAKGMLNSGATLKKALSICKTLTEEQRDTVISEYRWAISQALLVTQTWVEQLIIDAIESLQPLHLENTRQIKKICESINSQDLATRLISELKLTEDAIANDIALALRSGFAERRRGLVKQTLSFPIRLISRIFS